MRYLPSLAAFAALDQLRARPRRQHLVALGLNDD